MRKALIALATSACFIAAAASPADAQGRAERQFFRALGVGAAVVGAGLLFGAAARAHLDPRYHAWAPYEGYYAFEGPVVYAGPPPINCPGGFWAYRVNAYGQPYGQPRWTCPPQGYSVVHYYYR